MESRIIKSEDKSAGKKFSPKVEPNISRHLRLMQYPTV